VALPRRTTRNVRSGVKSPGSGVRPGKPASGGAKRTPGPLPKPSINESEPLEMEEAEPVEEAAEAVEEISEGESETIVADDPSPEDADVPGEPEPSAKGKSGRHHRTTSAARHRSSGSAAQKSADEGGGRSRIQGWSLATKFSLFISLLILIISVLFGLVVISMFKEKLNQEVISSGYQNALTLRALGNQVLPIFRGDPINSDEQKFAQSDAGKKLLADMQDLKVKNPRIKDIMIFYSQRATNYPSSPVLQTGEVVALSAPTENTLVKHPGESECKIWGTDLASSGGGSSKVYCFFVPIEGSLNQSTSAVYLTLSRDEIDKEAQNLMTKVGIFGLIFVAAGIALSLGLAYLVTTPMHALVRDMDIVAKGDLDHVTRPQTRDEIGLLAASFNRMTKSLRQARDQDLEVQRLNADLSMAVEVHAKLLPSKLPQIPGYDFGQAYHSAKEVGGDYYDFFGVDNKHMGMVVADVSGKGITGSMVMGQFRTTLRLMAPFNLSPADVLSKTNVNIFREIRRGMFVTCMYIIVNMETREMTVASAGHNAMVIWRQATKTHEMVRPNGIALGFDKGPVFDRVIREQKIRLNAGDRVVLYTDGVTESMSPEREEWGDDKLVAFVNKHAQLKSKEFVRLLARELEVHQGAAEQHDDITIVTLRVE